MQITEKGDLMVSINGKTKLLSKEEIVKMYNQGTILASESNSVTNTRDKWNIEGNLKPATNSKNWRVNDIKDDYPYFVTHTAQEYPNSVQEEVSAPAHYNNEGGSLYEFCERNGINSYEFDIIKRVMRCRKKGLFKEDLEKTKFLIDLYLKEFKEKTKENKILLETHTMD